jgi:DNA topoisomerase-1
MPRKIGMYEDKEMSAGIGRFGPYIRHDSKFYSIPKEDDVYTIDEVRAIEVIKDKRQKEVEKTINVFAHDPEIKVLKGRFGPYITMDKNNYKIPKGKDAASLTLEECLEIIKNDTSAGKKKRGFTPRKKAGK